MIVLCIIHLARDTGHSHRADSATGGNTVSPQSGVNLYSPRYFLLQSHPTATAVFDQDDDQHEGCLACC